MYFVVDDTMSPPYFLAKRLQFVDTCSCTWNRGPFSAVSQVTSDAFNVILGQDWRERVRADISFAQHTVVVSDSIGKRIKLIPQDTDVDVPEVL